jgi:hypothetical protein
MRFLLTIVLLAFFAAFYALAQQPDPIGLSDFPVPSWPSDGVVPASMKDNYVFVDPPKNEYVLAYPENLGTETFAKDGPGRMRISRYELLRNVAPVVSVAITPAAGKLLYDYAVANGSSAKQSIDTWLLVLPETAGTDTLKTPEGWFGIVQKQRKFKLKNPEWIRTGAAAVWSFQKPEQFIMPGSSKKGFQIESELRPGFTVAFLRKSESVDVKVTTQGNVPKEVKEQLDQLLALEYNSRTVLTYGPKFERSAADYNIAEDYLQGIITLSRAGILDLSSEFLRNLMSELTLIKPGATATVKLSASPKTAAETDLLNALKNSLRVN